MEERWHQQQQQRQPDYEGRGGYGGSGGGRTGGYGHPSGAAAAAGGRSGYRTVVDGGSSKVRRQCRVCFGQERRGWVWQPSVETPTAQNTPCPITRCFLLTPCLLILLLLPVVC